MKIFSVIKRIIKKPRTLIIYLNSLGLLSLLSDKLYAKLMWYATMGQKLSLNNPHTFSEKLQWLKIYDRNPLYTQLVDKYKVRIFIKERVGEKYLIPLLGVWDNANEIDFNNLPDRFVLKCNHNSGEGMYLCDKSLGLNIDEIRTTINRALKKNYYFEKREWPYKDVKRKVIAEKYMEDDSNIALGLKGLIDYKFYCFNGVPKFLYIGIADNKAGRKGDSQLTFYDLKWTKTPFYRNDHAPFPIELNKPDCLNRMIDIAAKLSDGIPFVRVDLYYINGHIYFSELTFSPGGGFSPFYPTEWEEKIGEWIRIS